MDLRIKGKTALITGGSRGIGLGVAKLLAEEGCKLHLVSRKAENLDKARQEIRDSLSQLTPILTKQKYLMNDEFSMLDVAIAPLLWRLEHYGIELPKVAAPVLKYRERLFSRPAFISALTPTEKALRK